MYSANFDYDESVKKIADILATAPVLEKCNIQQQRGSKNIEVAVEYATEDSMGAIIVKKRQNLT